jgi:hypothetical protein
MKPANNQVINIQRDAGLIEEIKRDDPRYEINMNCS